MNLLDALASLLAALCVSVFFYETREWFNGDLWKVNAIFITAFIVWRILV